MKKKTLFIIATLVAFILFVPSVMAAEKEVKSQQELINALNDITVTDITLGADITITEKDTTPVGDRAVGLVIERNVIIDGKGHTISNSSQRTSIEIYAGSNTINVTLKDLEITNSLAKGRCIDTRTANINLTLDDVTLKATGSGNVQPLTIGGNAAPTSEGTPTITINAKNSTLEAGDKGYAIITYNPITLNVENSTLSGYAAIYFKGVDSSYGSKDSITTIKDSLLTVNSNEEFTFGAIVFEDNDIEVNVIDSNIEADVVENSEYFVFKWNALNGKYDYSENEDGVEIEEIEGNKVTISGTSEITATGEGNSIISETETENDVIINAGVTTNLNVEKDHLPEGAVPFEDENGNSVIREKVTIILSATYNDETETEEAIFPKGYKFTKEDLEELKEMEKYINEFLKEEKTDLIFKGFYLDKEGKNKVDLTKTLTEDATWYMIIGKQEALEENPKTGDINLFILIGTILVGMLGSAFVLKKRFLKAN